MEASYGTFRDNECFQMQLLAVTSHRKLDTEKCVAFAYPVANRSDSYQVQKKIITHYSEFKSN